MAIVKYNLEPIYRGDSKEYNLTFTNSNGEKINISEWKVYFTVKTNRRSSDDLAIIKKDIIVHDDPTNGKTKIILLPEDTENLKPGVIYYYDIQVKRDVNNILTVLSGRMKIISDITRRTD